MTKKRRHTATEIASKLEKAAALAADGRTQREIAQTLGISVMTFHRWRRAQPGRPRAVSVNSPAEELAQGVSLREPQRLRRMAELNVENARLRKLVTDLLLEKMRLEEEAQRAGAKRGPYNSESLMKKIVR